MESEGRKTKEKAKGEKGKENSHVGSYILSL